MGRLSECSLPPPWSCTPGEPKAWGAQAGAYLRLLTPVLGSDHHHHHHHGAPTLLGPGLMLSFPDNPVSRIQFPGMAFLILG